MSPQNNHLQRPPAAVLYADELAKLKQNDNAPCSPGWQLSLPAARAFILGDSAQNIREGANKRGNSSRLTQSFHFFMFESIFSPVNALNQPI